MKKQLSTFFILLIFFFIGTKASFAGWVWTGETSWVDPDQLREIRLTSDINMLSH